MINIEEIKDYARSIRYVQEYSYWGEEGFYYNRPGSVRKRGFPFFTFKEEKGDIYLSFHLNPEDYEKMFGKMPEKFEEIEEKDLKKEGPFTQHPTYAWQGWILAKNPEQDDDLKIKEIMQKAHSFGEENDAKEG